MKKNLKFCFLLLPLMGLLLTNCSNDDNIVPVVEPEVENPETEEPTATVADYPVQDFMWRAMNFWYFWKADVPDLANDRFTDVEDPEYLAFLASEENPAAFFNNQLKFSEDRFSYFRENYQDLVQSSEGISKSNGLQFNLYRKSGNDDVYGVVTYIVPDSDASKQDIERGDVFVGVDGVGLYSNRSNTDDNNWRMLYDSSIETYVLNMADIRDDGDITDDDIMPNGREVSLTKEPNLVENPIFIDKIIERGGTKIGYLLYNGFTFPFNEELNEVFGTFKSENISELILDFRYNPGGSVASAIQIASSVHTADTTAVFLQRQVNSNLEDTFFGESENFTDKTFENEVPLNVLGLNRLFVITSRGSASASELVINGLEPYVDVVQIGDTTVGKNEFSVTLVDDVEGAYLENPERHEFINPDVQWGLQPLIGKSANADDFSGYENGLIPDHGIVENAADYGVLGEEDEPLLDFTLSIISGGTAKNRLGSNTRLDMLTTSQLLNQKGSGMLMDGVLSPASLPLRKE